MLAIFSENPTKSANFLCGKSPKYFIRA